MCNTPPSFLYIRLLAYYSSFDFATTSSTTQGSYSCIRPTSTSTHGQSMDPASSSILNCLGSSRKVCTDGCVFSVVLMLFRLTNKYLIKRSHEEMAAGYTPDPRHPPWHRNFLVDPPIPPQGTSFGAHGSHTQPIHRHVGDGLDFRRPVMSQPAENIIDLTEEPSSPMEPLSEANLRPTTTRFHRARRNVVDLEDDDESPELQSERAGENREPSPEIELLYSRPLASAAAPRARSVTNSIPDRERARNAAGSAASLVERAMAGFSRNLSSFQALNRSFGGTHRHVEPPPHHHHHHHHDHHHHHHRHAHQVPNDNDLLFLHDPGLDLVLPHHLDFETQGFRMGRTPRPSVPPPTYDPPPAPRQGFTRTPKEEEILICPNCSEELGLGEDELKRQVWVIKSCGHVSCWILHRSRPAVIDLLLGLLR